MITPWFNNFFNWLLPQSCFLCGDKSEQAICHACSPRLPYQRMACRHCARLLPAGDECDNCRITPPPYTRTQAIFLYTYPINRLIVAAKFNRQLALLDWLGNTMASHLISEPKPNVLIPVPIHPRRLLTRGFNQSVELAKCISKQLEIPLNYRACKRIKNTLPQTSLNWEQRQVNLQGAFKVTYIDPQWQHIVLIDDVMTTGNTVAELARVFKEAGIQRVDVWCCARAIGYTHAKEWWSQRRAEGNDCGETN